MGNSGSEPKKKVCKCRSCLHFKVFKDSSFITMEKIYEKTSHEPENEAKGLFICFKHCRLIARDNKQVKHRKKTYFNTFYKENWKSYFIHEATKIREECCWSVPMIRTIKKLKNPHFLHFCNEINFINYLTNIFVPELRPEFSLLENCGNLEEHEKNWDSLQLKREKFLKEEEITNLLRSLGIFPEEFFSFGWDDVNDYGAVNISHEFYNKNSNSNDNPLFMDKQIKSTKDSLRLIHKITDRSINNMNSKKKTYSEIINSSNLAEYRNNTIIGMMQCNQNSENKKEYDFDFNKQKIHNLHHYKLTTEVIEKHIDNDNYHPLAFIKKKFIDFYLNYYRVLLKETSNITEQHKKAKFIKAIYEDSICDLQKFIRIFQETVAIYYSLYHYKCYMKPPFYFCKDNLLNFITSIIFSDPKVYDLLLELQILQEHANEENIHNNLEICKTWTLKDFNVPVKFWLTEKSLVIKDLKDNDKSPRYISYSSYSDLRESVDRMPEYSKTANMTPLLEEVDKFMFHSKSLCSGNFADNMKTLAFDYNFVNLGKNAMKRTEFISEKKKSRNSNDYEPYDLAIKNLRKIENIKSPILKLKNIIKTSVLVIDAINQFYEKNKIEMNYQIESDDILSLFIYICSKAQVKNLFSQCKLTEKFLTSKISNSISGYYLITLMASLSYFAEKYVKKMSK